MIDRLIRILYPHGAVRTVLRGPMRGMRFTVVPGMGATYALGVDFLNLASLKTRVKPGMTVWDIGANCGQMALYFSRAVGQTGKVYSFEPAPANATILRNNVAANALTNVTVVEAALAREPGVRAFVFDGHDHTMGSLDGLALKLPGRQATLDVKCESVDHLMDDGFQPPDVIKIDVEGAGAEVIAGAERTLTRHRPQIYFELHADHRDSPELLALQRLRDQWGYRVTVIQGSLEEEPHQLWGATVWCEPS
jgi:FkbM family methyltransferase